MDAVNDLGLLAAALAKAQAQFPPITRDKRVTVTTKTGGSYTFTYAPLDAIISATRGPLTDNGLVVVQLLDEGSLVTRLIHGGSGASLTGRIDLPDATDIQGLGSAITYLRRYAMQAILGIAAEDDDDGNRHTGNAIRQGGAPDRQASDDGSLVGTVEVGTGRSSDFLVRQTPEGSALGFKLRGERGGILVECVGPLADQLHARRDAVVGQRVQVWGAVTTRSFQKEQRTVEYQVMAATRVRLPGGADLPGPAEAPTTPMFDANEQALLDEALGVTR